MEAFPPKPRKERERAEAALRADNYRKILQSGEPGWVPGTCERVSATTELPFTT